jgi:hypothetical protein
VIANTQGQIGSNRAQLNFYLCGLGVAQGIGRGFLQDPIDRDHIAIAQFFRQRAETERKFHLWMLMLPFGDLSLDRVAEFEVFKRQRSQPRDEIVHCAVQLSCRIGNELRGAHGFFIACGAVRQRQSQAADGGHALSGFVVQLQGNVPPFFLDAVLDHQREFAILFQPRVGLQHLAARVEVVFNSLRHAIESLRHGGCLGALEIRQACMKCAALHVAQAAHDQLEGTRRTSHQPEHQDVAHQHRDDAKLKQSHRIIPAIKHRAAALASMTRSPAMM